MMAVSKGDAARLAASSQAVQQQQPPPPPPRPARLLSLHAPPAEVEEEIEVDLREVYFLIMHFLSSGPCHRATGQLWNELLQHKLLPRRYHGLHSRSGVPSSDENDDGSSFPLSYVQVTERYKNIEKNHLIKLLQQLLVHDKSASLLDAKVPRPLTAADVPTLLGSGAFSLLESEQRACNNVSIKGIERLRWPHWQALQVHALALRELGGGFAKHHRSPSIRTPKHVIVKPSVLVDRIRITKILRGHRNAVYSAVFDRTGRHLVTGSDDRLVKIWSTESGLCLRSCRGHEGDITDMAVSFSNTLVASASNDFSIRVWRLPDGGPVSVLRGHTAGVTAIEFSPRQGCEHHLLSSSEDGTCRIWDARDASVNSRVYMPKPDQDTESTGTGTVARAQASNQILCCKFNADGSFFVTGSSDKLARVWDARKWSDEFTGRPNHELDILRGHENVVNYVQFSGCAEPTRASPCETSKEDNLPRFKNAWFAQDSIVTCSRDGSAIIWSPRPRKQVKLGRWVKAYHLKVPPPPMPQPLTRSGGPRQRLLPTPRGVNMIVWSLDNRFVLAAIMDCRICVWNAVDGSLVHCLTGHNKQTYVLDVHPYNPRIAMSAGYDGRVIIWDIWEGRPVRTYETGDYNLVDGNFSPDGTSLVVSDEVGQVYLLSTGQASSQEDAKYDQFFLGDYRPLVRDTHGNILDQETQLPPHQRNLHDLLCDSSMIPYPEPYQSAYQQRRLGALGIDSDWQPPAMQLAIGPLDDPSYAPPEAPQPLLPAFENPTGQGNRWVEQPTDIDAMDWDEDAAGFSDDSGSDYCASEESFSDEGNEEASASTFETDTTDNEADEIDYDAVPTRRSRKKKAEGVGTPERQVKRRRLQESNSSVVPEESSKRHRRKSGKRVQTTDSDQSSRPMRVAARNALTMFSSLHEDEDDEGARPVVERPCPESSQPEGEASKESEECGEGEPDEPPPLKTAIDTSELGECRRPRSNRKLVLKLRNCSRSTNKEQNPESPEEVLKNDDVAHKEPEAVRSCEERGGDAWKKGKATKRIPLPYGSSSSNGSSHGKVVPKLSDNEDEPPNWESRSESDQEQNGGVSESEKSLSADYSEEHRRHQRVRSNESLQNGSAADKDPDYHEEVSNSESSEEAEEEEEEEQEEEEEVEEEEEEEEEEAYKPEDGEEASEDSVKRKRFKAVFTRRYSRKKMKKKTVDADAEAGPSNGRRRRSRRLVHSRANVVHSRMSTRNRGKARRTFHEDATSSSSCEDSEWNRSEGEDSEEDHRPERRTSTRLRGKFGKNVGSRYKDFHVRTSQKAVHRNPNHVSWLLLTEVEQTRYIPQFGDQVVYFRQGHQDYLENSGLDDDGPWRSFKSELRAVEFCEVIGLEYTIIPETGNTCCQLRLGVSRMRGRDFRVSLPELTDFADFIVERSRYEASMARNWSTRDKCQVWWRSDGEEGGSWWEGKVVQVKAKSAEYPDSPWDSICVQYKDEATTTLHSPWELHDIDNPLTWDPPQIDEEETQDLLDAIDEVLNSSQSKDEYGLWRLQQAVSKPDFLDRIPLPMSMDVIRTRLEKKYYRSVEAVAHDLSIMISNFRTYFGKDHSSVLKVERLRKRFSDVLGSVSL